MDKILFLNEDQYNSWRAGYNKGYLVYGDKPEKYPCVCVYYEYDISNSMSYGWGLEYEFVYPEDFEE